MRHRNEVELVGVLGAPPSVGLGPDGALQLRLWLKTREGADEQTHAVLHCDEERVPWLRKSLQQGDTVIVEGRLAVWRDKSGARSHAIVHASRVVLPMQQRLLAS
jgi:primosomal replication protein N